jgi:hypothetical protein
MRKLTEEQSAAIIAGYRKQLEKLYDAWMSEPSFETNERYHRYMYITQKKIAEHEATFYPF